MYITDPRVEEIHRLRERQVRPDIQGRTRLRGSFPVFTLSDTTYVDTCYKNQSAEEIENVFPEVLRDPILRKVQFQTVSRMDELGMIFIVKSTWHNADCL